MGSAACHRREQRELVAVGYRSLESGMDLIHRDQRSFGNPGGAGKQIAQLPEDVGNGRRRCHAQLHRAATGQIGVCREKQDTDVHGWKDNG